ncbi:hypothetical protein DOY81_012828 [Sarcophaga bullata]|nr:hypothetical protein DOY81_012828 [Sarcophaga bullata]
MVIYLMDAAIEAQRVRPRCPQGANPSNCTGAMNNGTSCPTAQPRRMWYYDINSRGCRDMQYLGCGGNANRFCSRRECVRRCIRGRP